MGLDDPTIILGYASSIGLAVACIVYGWLNRNKEEESDG
jgi:hypothetical protein